MKESEMPDNNVDIIKNVKNWLVLKVTVIPIIMGELVTVVKTLIKGWEDKLIGNRKTNWKQSEDYKTVEIADL